MDVGEAPNFVEWIIGVVGSALLALAAWKGKMLPLSSREIAPRETSERERTLEREVSEQRHRAEQAEQALALNERLSEVSHEITVALRQVVEAARVSLLGEINNIKTEIAGMKRDMVRRDQELREQNARIFRIERRLPD